MRGLCKIPQTADLLTAYNVLQSRELLTEEQIVLYSQWSRFDPRLGEQLTAYLAKRWGEINLLNLRKRNLVSDWPQALAVIFEHLTALISTEKSIFKLCHKLIITDLEPVKYQSYFIGLFKIGGREIFAQAQSSHPYFSQWGYYAALPMLAKNARPKTETLLSSTERKNILGELLKAKKNITVNDYLTACRFSIHPRQAERDLQNFFKLKKSGNTRSRTYSK